MWRNGHLEWLVQGPHCRQSPCGLQVILVLNTHGLELWTRVVAYAGPEASHSNNDAATASPPIPPSRSVRYGIATSPGRNLGPYHAMRHIVRARLTRIDDCGTMKLRAGQPQRKLHSCQA